MDELLASLKEREKELECLYRVGEILSLLDEPLGDICSKIVEAIPPGWQYPDICSAKIEIEGVTYCSANYEETSWVQSDKITARDLAVGTISVYYSVKKPEEDDGPFLKEESKLLHTIGERLGGYVLQQKMLSEVQELNGKQKTDPTSATRKTWQTTLSTLKQSQGHLYLELLCHMLDMLRQKHIPETEILYQQRTVDDDAIDDGSERLSQSEMLSADLGSAVLELAIKHLSDQQILEFVQTWIHDHKPNVLAKLVNRNLSVAEIAEAIQRYPVVEDDSSSSHLRGTQVSLIRRFLSGQPDYMSAASRFISVPDFSDLLQRTIFTATSRGSLGGKAARFFLAERIIKTKQVEDLALSGVDTPRTWFITSDVLFHFLHYQALDNVVEQKYKELSHVQLEYSEIVRTFKEAQFPPGILNAVRAALEDLGEGPLVIRSSNFLDDKPGVVFSGKYSSIFVANLGSKEERLEAVMSAIAEVYASTFGPEPIKYRAECGLLDFGEEMGIMIQKIIGTTVGKYFLPSVSGTVSSICENIWCPGVKKRDGLARLVPGLDVNPRQEESEDWAVLLIPGRGGKRVYVNFDDKVRYSPKQIQVIDLEADNLTTITPAELLLQAGQESSVAHDILSLVDDGKLVRVDHRPIDFAKDTIVITFAGLVSNIPLVSEMNALMRILTEEFGGPVEIEFASDGKKLYVLHYRLLVSPK